MKFVNLIVTINISYRTSMKWGELRTLNANLDLYRVFHAAAKAGSLTAAAKSLYVSQPAVSYSIRKLEDQLGVRLFQRMSRGIRLTPEGEALFQHVDQAYGLIMAGEKKLLDMKNLSRGEVRIGASDTLCKHYLVPLLEKFNAEYPDVKFHVTNRTSLETIQLLRGGKVDFGIVNLPIPEDDGLKVKETIKVRDCFIVGKRYKDLSKSPIHLKDLTNYPILLLEQASITRTYVDRFAAREGVRLEPEIELGSIDLLIEFAKIGLGVACVVRNFIDEEIKKGQLFEVRLTHQIPSRSVGIVTLKGVPLPPAARKFAALL